jgi:hypothetical protein
MPSFRAAMGAALLMSAAAGFHLGPARAQPIDPDAGPNGSVGWETFRRLDRLPYLSVGSQTLQFSSFDRSGGDFNRNSGNHNGSGGCIAAGGAGCVIAQDAGPGEIDSIWFTRSYGVVTALGHIRIELDGAAVMDAPLQAVVDGKLGAPFVFPLVANGDQSPGGVYIKVPMPYRRSMRISVTSNLNYYHVTYRHFPSDNGVPAFDRADHAADVLAMLRAAGTRDPKPAQPQQITETRTVDIPPAADTVIAAPAGSAGISALTLHVPHPTDAVLRGLRLRIAFDGRALVDSPVGEFFGAGLGASTVDSLLFTARPDGTLSTWWPMPFAHNATVSLENTTARPIAGLRAEITVAPDPRWAAALAEGRAGYFTALSHAGTTVAGQDWTFADQAGHGKFVGVSEGMRGFRAANGFTPFLEGAERVYVDNSNSPQLYGTGTEDYYEGGWYFRDGKRFSDPLTGMPDNRVAGPGCAYYCLATYRIMLGDAVAYDSALHFGIEHGKRDMFTPDYSSTAFLYTQPDSIARPGDVVQVASPLSRLAHGYNDSGTTQQSVVSEYEGIDDLTPLTRLVRAGTEPIVFHMVIPPDNDGILLRRTFDQMVGYQSADVLVDGAALGTWLEAHSNPIHRWRDDTFPLPASVTHGKVMITVTLVPSPGAPAWTATSYRADPLGEGPQAALATNPTRNEP